MKSVVKYLFILATLVSTVLVGGCVRDDVDGGVKVEAGYGADLEITLPADFSGDFPLGTLTCVFETESGVETIYATHTIVDGVSVLTLSEYLPVGANVLTSVEYVDSVSDGMFFDLGCTVNVGEESNSIFPTNYNLEYKLFGSGTSDDPFLISSAINFLAINSITSTSGLNFKQTRDIDFSLYFGHESGFEGVCPDVNKPFRGSFDGQSYTISNLAIRRYSDADIDQAVSSNIIEPAGLFCAVAGATIKNIVLDNPDIWGHEAVGGVVGMVNGTTTEETSASLIENCSIKRSISNDNMIYGTRSVGGVIGAIEYGANASVKSCNVDSLVMLKIRSFANKGSYLGGIIGGSGLASQVYIESCNNSAELTADGISCTGGIIGTGEFITMVNCTNSANITVSGDSSFGVGGLIGGSVDAAVVASTNSGVISGYRGVGGILGSTAYDTGAENPMFGNIILASCHNYGAITGSQSIGGQVGEAQANFTNCYNTGTVTKVGNYDECEAGGLIGFGSVATVRGSYNLANITGNHSGGLVGVGEYFYLYTSANFGAVNGSGAAGGLIGHTSEYGVINYVNNYGSVTGSGEIGGLIGKLGEANSSSDKLATFKEEAIREVIAMVVKSGGEKLSEVIAVLLKVKEVITIVRESIELIQVLSEGAEGEAEDLAESIEEDIANWTATLDKKMIDEVTLCVDDDDATYHYAGDLSITENISRITLENIMALNTELDTGDSSSDEFLDSVYEEVEEICEKNAIHELCKEIEEILISCALGVMSLALGGVTGIVAYAAGSILLSAETTYTEDELNTIVVCQSINYGHSDGNGLVGAIGDRIRFRNCISAGKSNGNAIANDADGKNLYSEMLISIGDKDKDPYSDGKHSVYCYGDYDADDFADSDTFSDYDSSIWNIEQSGGKVPLPYNSEFFKFKN